MKSILVKEFNERGQVYLVMMESNPDGEFKYILHYIDNLTKFHILCRIKSKTAAEVAKELLYIFLDIGLLVHH